MATTIPTPSSPREQRLPLDAWAAFWGTLRRLLVSPRYYTFRDDEGNLEEVLVRRGDVYIRRDVITGDWVVELRGTRAVSRLVLR
jgi:hypothetical protein